MAEAIYVLCALTSAVCAALLLRAWLASRVRLLAWAAASFLLLTANNVLLFVDLALIPGTDLSEMRSATGFAGLVVLLFGLIFDREAGRA